MAKAEQKHSGSLSISSLKNIKMAKLEKRMYLELDWSVGSSDSETTVEFQSDPERPDVKRNIPVTL